MAKNEMMNKQATNELLLKVAHEIANSLHDFTKNSNSIALYIRDELSNLHYDRKIIVRAWEQGHIYRISQRCKDRLASERYDAIQKQRQDYYINGPVQRITEEDNKITVEYGRVENVEERKFDYFSSQGAVDWDNYNEHGLSAGKKCQIIKLANDNRVFRVVYSTSARGVETYDVIRFEGIILEKYINIPRSSNISGTGTFSVSNPITVNNTWYPSIAAAYAIKQPQLSYGYITKLLRDGISPDDAFTKGRQSLKAQAHGKVTKTLK